ncbi:hypothetical protein H0B56_17665 [Haloechinothrix sp. YIM 98757]|uniref:Uncharacterized protein n=1 Tax=Haloechinothrix aidingensis TaxID=2752311 RepID=A0A838ADW6_9PSEU|nr:hypothetical protein [Haloechinothrix aidingensis]MBA0127377.1 hypothetical protein [Haloechinothrix aidingensis]
MWRGIGAPAAVAVLLLVAGCGAGDENAGQVRPEPSRQQAAESDGGTQDSRATEWADSYCSATLRLVHAVSTSPQVDPSSPERASKTSMDMLTTVSEGLRQAERELDGLAPAPIRGADEVLERTKGEFSELRDRSESARNRLAATRQREEPDVAETRSALDVTSNVLDEVGEVNLLGGMEEIPEFVEASRSARSCAELLSSGSRPSLNPDGSRE